MPTYPDTNSIVDYLSSKGMDTSPQGRATLYEQQGLGKATDYLDAYTNTVSGQGNNSALNTALLNKLRGLQSNDGIVSGTKATEEYNQNNTNLNNFTNTPDPYMQLIEKRNALSDQQYQRDVATATTQGARAMNAAQEASNRYKAGLETLGIQSGLSQYAPDLQAGKILGAENLLNNKIQDLQDREDMAIAKAKAARDNRDVANLKMQLDRAKEIREEKADAIKEAQLQRSRDIEFAGKIAPYALQELAKLGPAQKEAFIQQLAEENNISALSLIQAMAAKTYTKPKAGGEGGTLSTTELQRIEELYGVTLPYGTSKAEAMSILGSQEEGGGGGSTGNITTESLSDNYSNKQLWNLALNIGGTRKKNFSKEDEIEQLITLLPSYLEQAYKEGYSDEEITEFLESKMK